MNLIWLLLLVCVAVAIGVFAYYKSGSNKADEVAEPTVKVESPLDDLPALNLAVRKSLMPIDLIIETETVIDKLVELIPAVDQCGSPTGELKWSVNRIATEYLPNKCVFPFLRMSDAERTKVESVTAFKNNLVALSDELDDVSAMLSRRNTDDFNAKAKFLEHRFNTTGEV